jgi:hypothetical protein
MRQRALRLHPSAKLFVQPLDHDRPATTRAVAEAVTLRVGRPSPSSGLVA